MNRTTLLLLAFFHCMTVWAQAQPSAKPTKDSPDGLFSVEYPEVYELANIILALTDYGLNDKWQVRKDFDYYREMRDFFKAYQDHPLLDSVNFSRERWAEFLSFRTDAYAFKFDDKGKIVRTNEFHAFEHLTFDKYLPLVEDFARQTGFRSFFQSHQSYYQGMIESYRKEYLLPQMKDFLSREFGDYFSNKKYSIVLSPFVYAQNLHRDINNTWTADFPTIAQGIVDGTGFPNKEEKSTELHTLFSEMDHGYVNPTTSKYDLPKYIDNQYWDKESGYTDEAVFNEYMTWAAFDLFNDLYFPEIAEKINLNWHIQNETRGFIYSAIFGQKLKELYRNKGKSDNIASLYPKMLEWMQSVQTTLSKPRLLNDGDSLKIQADRNVIQLNFSEAMQEAAMFDAVLEFDQWTKKTIQIGPANNLKWSNNGTQATFDLTLPQQQEYYLVFNWWGVTQPLISKKGVHLSPYCGFLVKQ
ncbi:MAG: DUF4932 domain-containing protein [Saprospiraceae bacterium]|nr:DUF4932 domain-containing protein [Saprospiraceae bacterium]